MNKFIALVAASLCTLAAGAANAGNVYWSVGISAPAVGTVISNAPVVAAPVYLPPPVVVAPQPVYVPSPPVYVEPPRVIYRPAPVVYAPAPVVYAPAPYVVYRDAPRHGHHRHGGWGPGRGHRDEYGSDYRGGHWNDQRRYRHDR